MARPPFWCKIETLGRTPSGNMGIRLTIRWWAVPFLYLMGLWRLLTGRSIEDVPESCDGVEVIETKIGGSSRGS